MSRRLTFSLAGAALLLAGTAIAQTAPTPSQATATPQTERAARPAMTRDTALEHAGQMFTRLDANADGQLDAADRQERTEDRLEAHFDRIDTNSDNAISREEFAAMGEARHERLGGRMGERGGRGGMGRMGHARELLTTADADGNSAISQAEFTAAMIARFDAADANDDGTVTAEERRAARPEGAGQRGHNGRGR